MKTIAHLYSTIRNSILTFSSSFRKKLILNLLLVAVLPLILLGILSYALSFNIAKDKIIDSVSYSNSQLNDTLSDRFSQMEDASNVMQSHMSRLVLQPDPTISNQLESYNNIRNNLYNLITTFGFSNISVYTTEEFIFSNEGMNFFNVEELPNHGVSLANLNPDVNELHWESFNDVEMPFILNQSTETPDYISVYSAFKQKDQDLYDYVFFIDILQEEIRNLLLESSPDSSVISYLINSSGTIISHSHQSSDTSINNELLTTIVNHSGEPFTYDNKQIIAQRNLVTGWYVVTEVPNQYIRDNTYVLLNILLITLLLVVLAVIITSFFISKNLSRKITHISNSLSGVTFQGNQQRVDEIAIPVQKNEAYRDEFDNLSLTFNKMIGKINQNFEQILEMNRQEEKMKYQLQQSKINPHFLYNILDSIKTCQKVGRIEEGSLMITNLAKFYRKILRNEEELITIREEIEIVTLYLEMENISKSNAVNWIISKDEQIEYFLIPKFTLQPLLENCIKHGLTSTDKEMTIDLSFKYKEEDIIIKITDDGIGMREDRLKEVQQSLENKDIDANHFFGINNVNIRLSMYSNQSSAVVITSKKGIGTTVTISIKQMISDEFLP